jgi:hypothetical protein
LSMTVQYRGSSRCLASTLRCVLTYRVSVINSPPGRIMSEN